MYLELGVANKFEKFGVQSHHFFHYFRVVCANIHNMFEFRRQLQRFSIPSQTSQPPARNNKEQMSKQKSKKPVEKHANYCCWCTQHDSHQLQFSSQALMARVQQHNTTRDGPDR
jgi:hypothetical protein